jgi:ABC-2 type transport system permease protein
MSAFSVTWRTAWRDTWADRRTFWTQAVVMAVNDIVWVVFWTLFFRRVGTVRGWSIDHVIVLQAALTTSGGVALGLFANCRNIAALTHSGRLDATLALPTRPLAHLLASRIETIHVGDLLFGVALFATRGHPTPERVAAFALGVTCATAILIGFLVLAGSLSFFTGRNDAGDLGFHAVLLFGSYPIDIFTGTTKLLLYVVIPAGFIAAAPARLVADLDVTRAATLVGVAVAFATAGALAFTSGLRRYTSGAIWTHH